MVRRKDSPRPVEWYWNSGIVHMKGRLTIPGLPLWLWNGPGKLTEALPALVEWWGDQGRLSPFVFIIHGLIFSFPRQDFSDISQWLTEDKTSLSIVTSLGRCGPQYRISYKR